MKPATRNFAVLGACIVVLGGVLAGLLMTGGSEGDVVSSGVLEQPSEDIALLNKEESDISSIEISNTNGLFTIVPAEKQPETSAAGVSSQDASSGEENVTFTIAELEGLPQDTYTVNTAAEGGWKLFATKKIGTVSNPSEFGLSTPRATVHIRFQDGSTYGYVIGNTSAEDSAAYYLRGVDSEEVYVVKLPETYLDDKRTFLSRQVLDFSALGDGTAAPFRRLVLDGKALTQPITLEQGQDGLYVMTEPNRMETDEAEISGLTDMLSTLTASEVAALHPDTTQLREYGLENPINTVELYCTDGNTYLLKAGAGREGDRFLMLDGVDIVYRVAEDVIAPWVNILKPFDVQDKALLTGGVENVKSLSVTLEGGMVFRWDVARTKDEEKSTEDTPYYNYAATDVAGAPVDYDRFQTLYRQFAAETVLEEADGQPETDPVLTVKVETQDGSAAQELVFYSSGERACVAVLNGSVRGSVPRTDVDALAAAVQGMA